MERLARLSARLEEAVERASSILEQASTIVVLTGAGVSAESGIPTFRGSGGLWRSRRPEELATPEAFEENPELVWDMVSVAAETDRRMLAKCGAPSLGQTGPQKGGVTLITQNVDGLHNRVARTEAKALNISDTHTAFPLELHGAINRDRCSLCDRLTDAVSHS